jgi:peptidoglycan/LPS O-acetylase OafA/YrhL
LKEGHYFILNNAIRCCERIKSKNDVSSFSSMRVSKLDGLRGVFCLMVVLVHYKPEFLPVWFRSSFFVRQAGLFVDFFFVLSGFVISLNYSNVKSFSDFTDYIKRRFIRLYPLLFFSTTLYVLYYVISDKIKVLIPSLSSLFQSSEPTAGIGLATKYFDTILFLNSTPILGTTMGMNYPSWSISSEMIVYLVFGLVMMFTSRKRMVTIAFLIILFLSVAFSVFNDKFFFAGDYGFIRAYVSFTVGHFVWVLSKRKFKVHNFLEWMIAPLILLLFYILNETEGQVREMIGLGFVPLFFGLSILTLIKSNGLVSRMLETKPFGLLGKTSYSIYLNHALLLVLIPKSIFRLLKLPQTEPVQLMVLLLTLTAIVGYSYLTYLFVEKRGGAMFKKRILLKKSIEV